MAVLSQLDVVNHLDVHTPVTSQRVVLVRPARVSSKGTWSVPITPPIGLAYIAAVLVRGGHQVTCVDALAENVDQLIRDDVYMYQGLTIAETVERIPLDSAIIGVSGLFTQDWPWMRHLFRAIRDRCPSALIVAGGEHFTALSEFSLRDCRAIDIVVRGEGELTMLAIANNADNPARLREVPGIAYLDENDGYQQTVARGRVEAINELPWPAWDLFPMDVYMADCNAFGVYRGRSMAILGTRGCPYQCTFCSNPAMYGKLWMARDPSDLLDEIESYIAKYQASNFDFYDLTMVLKRDWILEFCRQIEERGLKITWQLPSGTRSEVIDEEVSAALYRTGCRNVTYAPESGSERTLDVIKKRVHLDRLIVSARAALRNKIHVKCNIIIGFPHETRKDVLKTIGLCWRLAVLGVDAAEIMCFSPYPGTQLYNELRADGTISDLTEDYFRSLVAFLDPFVPSKYCKKISGHELIFWRLFGMSSFFAISFALRPWRFVRLIKSMFTHKSETVLEHRLGAFFRRRMSSTASPTPVAAGSAS